MRTLKRRRHEAGVALIMAILALMLLTIIGLTLATTTTTELQIASNYRWGQQAFYNAEAGLEGAKRVLQDLNWSLAVPAARPNWNITATPVVPPVAAPAPAATRDFEMGSCDRFGGGMGYGVVLRDGAGNALENVSNIAGGGLLGSVTVWVRRATRSTGINTYADVADENQLVVVAEGLSGSRDPARRVIEVTLQRQLGEPACTERRGAQAGGGAEGNNFTGACAPLADDAMDPVVGLAGAQTPGSGAKIQ